MGHDSCDSRSIHVTYSLVVSSFISVLIPLINFGPTWVRFHSHGDLVLAMVQSIYGWARRAVEQVSSIFCQEAVDLLCEDGKHTDDARIGECRSEPFKTIWSHCGLRPRQRIGAVKRSQYVGSTGHGHPRLLVMAAAMVSTNAAKSCSVVVEVHWLLSVGTSCSTTSTVHPAISTKRPVRRTVPGRSAISWASGIAERGVRSRPVWTMNAAMPGLVNPMVATVRSRLVTVIPLVVQMLGSTERGVVLPRKVTAPTGGRRRMPSTALFRSSAGERLSGELFVIYDPETLSWGGESFCCSLHVDCWVFFGRCLFSYFRPSSSIPGARVRPHRECNILGLSEDEHNCISALSTRQYP